MKKINRIPLSVLAIIASCMTSFIQSCHKFTDAGLPKTLFTAERTYADDATAISAVSNSYSNISNSNIPGSPFKSVGQKAGLGADELDLFKGYPPSVTGYDDYVRYYQNALLPTSANPWQEYYSYIFNANVAIAGLEATSSLTGAVKTQLLGEVKFIRAYMYFYLVNLYGDVPLPLSSDYTINQQAGRIAIEGVYAQIIQDLKDAQSLLSENFMGQTLLAPSPERIRPTKWAAEALLARVYLYNGRYAEAEALASDLIGHTALFTLPALNDAFLKNSAETIWSIQPVGTGTNSNTAEGRAYLLPATGPSTGFPVYLSQAQMAAFQPGDLRGTAGYWVGEASDGTTSYFYPSKYKIGSENVASAEYSIMFRLGEQYLIRAEARINQGNVAGGMADLNTLRTRARAAASTAIPDPLPALPTIMSNTEAKAAVLHERQAELFTEGAHRWLDLKRTGRIDEVMAGITPLKVIAGSAPNSWNPNWAYYPIPQAELDRSPLLLNHQNPGY